MKNKYILYMLLAYMTVCSVGTAESQWKKVETVPYTVNYYYQKRDGTYNDVPDKIKVKAGLANFWVGGEEDCPKGFSLDYKLSQMSQILKEDGSTVLNYYYELSTISIYFNSNEGVFSVTEWQGALYGLYSGKNGYFKFTGTFYDTFQVPPDPTRDGYVFVGWNRNDHIVKFDGAEEQFPRENQHYNAEWRKVVTSPVVKKDDSVQTNEPAQQDGSGANNKKEAIETVETVVPYIPLASSVQISDKGNCIINGVQLSRTSCISVPIHLKKVNDEFVKTDGPLLVGQYQVTCELWDAVIAWSVEHGYSIACGFVSQKMIKQIKENEVYKVSEKLYKYLPAGMLSYHDALVWCNAFSEMCGLTPVYYTDPNYTKPLRISTDTKFIKNLEKGSQDHPYIKAAKPGNDDPNQATADGWRLPTLYEWKMVAAGGEAFFDEKKWSEITSLHDEIIPVGSVDPQLYFTTNNNPTIELYDFCDNSCQWFIREKFRNKKIENWFQYYGYYRILDVLPDLTASDMGIRLYRTEMNTTK